MKYLISSLFFFLSLIVIGTSCVKQGEAEVPSYIIVDTTTVSVRPGEGTESARIPFIWVYVDNTFLGGYPVGKKIPVLTDGEVDVEIFAGIYTNGQIIHTDVYFMLASYKKKINLSREETVHLKPIFQYVDYITFSLIEDFESGNVFKEDFDSNPATRMERTTENVFEGKYSGLLRVTEKDSANSVAMTVPITEFARGGEASMFVEMNYMGSTDLVVGIIGLTEWGGEYNKALISLKPRDNYRKLYLDITEEIIQFRATTVTLFFIVGHNKAYGSEEQRIYIDNVKIINN